MGLPSWCSHHYRDRLFSCAGHERNCSRPDRHGRIFYRHSILSRKRSRNIGVAAHFLAIIRWRCCTPARRAFVSAEARYALFANGRCGALPLCSCHTRRDGAMAVSDPENWGNNGVSLSSAQSDVWSSTLTLRPQHSNSTTRSRWHWSCHRRSSDHDKCQKQGQESCASKETKDAGAQTFARLLRDSRTSPFGDRVKNFAMNAVDRTRISWAFCS